MDRERLVKLLGMTTSEHDGEALNAMKMANALLKAADTTWAEVLAPQQVVNISLQRHAPQRRQPYDAKAEEWTAPHLTDKVIIDRMFNMIYAQPRSDNEEFWQWVDSVHNQWRQHGRVSNAQYQALRRCYSRVMRN